MPFRCKKTTSSADILDEMSIADITINPVQIPPNWGVQPPSLPKQVAAQKPKPDMSAEDALNLLKLVNVGKYVLDVQSLGLSPEEMILAADSIKSARKSGMGVEFENGRIHVPEDLFKSILNACKKGPDRNINIMDASRPRITLAPGNPSQ